MRDIIEIARIPIIRKPPVKAVLARLVAKNLLHRRCIGNRRTVSIRVAQNFNVVIAHKDDFVRSERRRKLGRIDHRASHSG